jgi:hypothetical protein
MFFSAEKNQKTFFYCCLGLVGGALSMILGLAPAEGAWLHCSVSGSDGAGDFVYLTTLADVGKVPAARLKQFEARAAAYVAKADPDARVGQAVCFAPDDQLAANEHYSRLLGDSAARVGWDHVVVVRPRDWLAEKDIVDEPAEP